MPTRLLLRTAAAALFVALFAVAASAQVVTATGKVTLKQADGTTVPLKDAVIDFYRTDITQKFQTKTNAKGEYTHAGIPLTGVFTIAVSGPGARPTFVANVKISQRTENNFTLDPGDGARLTLEQIKSNAVATPTSGAASGAPVSAEDKKRAEELAKEQARVAAENQKAMELNAKLPDVLKSANAALTAKNYDEAVTLYDQGIQLDPTQSVFHLNKSIALRARGVEKYNAAAKAKDAAAKETAKGDLKTSAEEADKAVNAYTEHNKSAAGAAPATQNSAELLNYLSSRAESYRVALLTSTAVDSEAAAKAFQEYIAAETDPAKKMKAQANLGDALFSGGKIDEAITTYRQVLQSNPDNIDAMYGLGIALAAKVTDATKDAATITEARQLFQQFVSKAPDTHPHKADALASIQYLDETMKTAAASKSLEKQNDSKKGARRKP